MANPATSAEGKPIEIQDTGWRTWLSLSTIGPGIVFALTVMGSGDLINNAVAGAGYGYAMIWALGISLVFRYVWVNLSAKYVLVTGEPLIHGYARLGNWTLWLIFIAGVVLRHLYNMYLIVVIGTALDLLYHFPTKWSASIWGLVFTVLGYCLMVYGGYRIVDKVFKVQIAAAGVSMIVAAALAHPDPVGILKGTFIPSVPGQSGLYSALFVLMALVGMQAGSMTNLTYPYFMYEKGWRDKSYIKKQRFDLAFGIVCVFIMCSLLQIAAAGTLHPMGLKVEGPEQLAQIFYKTQGYIGLVIFALYLWGASFGAYIGGNLGYGLIMTDLCRTYIPRFKKPLDQGDKKKAIRYDPIYRICIAFWVFSPLYILFIRVRPVWLVLFVSSMMVVLIPVLGLAILKLTNDKKLMGKDTNGWVTNAIMWGLVLTALYFTYTGAVAAVGQIKSLF